MRLLDTRTLQVHNFLGATPSYVILSHRWGDNEVSLQEMQSLNDQTKAKAGYSKISGFCKLSLSLGYDHAWVDTCCIDQRNPSELSEAINSTFRWYTFAALCIVYLGDVDSISDPQLGNPEFETSKWFTRGWTLQELLAPSQVHFYSSEWKLITTKSSCFRILSTITGIDDRVLFERNFSDYSVACRMSWAAHRETTKLEDTAYCLLGIFNVNMPLLYGEGDRAFARLQQEIMKTSDDQSIFSWDTAPTEFGMLEGPLERCAPFASTPNSFSGKIRRLHTQSDTNHFSYQRKPYMSTNMGISITLPIIRTRGCRPPLKDLLASKEPHYAVLDCMLDGVPICIPVVPVSEDETRYQRCVGSVLTIDKFEGLMCDLRDMYLQNVSSQGERVENARPAFEHGRWSTESLEKRRVLDSLEVSRQSNAFGDPFADSIVQELAVQIYYVLVAFFVYWFLTEYLSADIRFLQPVFMAILLLNVVFKGAFTEHIRLVFYGTFSLFGLSPSNILKLVKTTVLSAPVRQLPKSSIDTWSAASHVSRYRVHQRNQMLWRILGWEGFAIAKSVATTAVTSTLFAKEYMFGSWWKHVLATTLPNVAEGFVYMTLIVAGWNIVLSLWDRVSSLMSRRDG